MSKPSPSDTEQRRKQAAAWLGRLGRGLQDDEGERLRQWLENPLNRKAIVESARMWHQPEVIAVLGALIPLSPDLQPGTSKPRSRVLDRSVPATAAACVFVAAALALGGKPLWNYLFHRSQLALPTLAKDVYTTAIGEKREIKLPDNTTIALNTGTRMVVVYAPRSRDVNLVYGEANFHVAPDPLRSFSVLAGRHNLAIDAASFDVRVLTADKALLTVTEGNVKVLYGRSYSPWDTPSRARLRDNYTFDDTTVGAVETALLEPGFLFARKIATGDADARLAWQHGMIVFKGARLQDALAEVDRYTNTRFVLADDKLRDMQIAGDFRTGDVDGLLQSLKKDFSIDSRRDAQGRVVLTSLAALPSVAR